MSGVYQVTKVDISTYGKYPAVGMITEKSTSTRCLVSVVAEVATSTTLIPERLYFIGFDSLITATPPVPAPSTRCALQVIGTALDAGKLLLHVHPQAFLRGGG